MLLHACEIGIAIDEKRCQWPGHGRSGAGMGKEVKLRVFA
jgi:hypothetical protein